MLFRPNFCANCGEKIERASWGVLTSRRFCPVCETEFKGQDLIPRAIVVAGLIVGIFGIGSYLKSGEGPNGPLSVRQPVKLVERVSAANIAKAPDDAGSAAADNSGSEPRATRPQIAAVAPVRSGSDEPIYFCGAETKKGTPCSRRVKGNVRCYQHAGMPAMQSAGKIKKN